MERIKTNILLLIAIVLTSMARWGDSSQKYFCIFFAVIGAVLASIALYFTIKYSLFNKKISIGIYLIWLLESFGILYKIIF